MAQFAAKFKEEDANYRQRHRKHAQEAGIVWPDGTKSLSLDIVLSVLTTKPPVHLEATMNHFELFLQRAGVSLSDIGHHARVADKKTGAWTLNVSVLAIDLFVWLLDMKILEMCGQTVLVSIAGQSPVYGNYRRNTNGLTEEKWLENLDCIRNYLPLKARDSGTNYDAAETKVFIWGEQYGSIPTKWPSKGRTITQAVCGDRHVVFLTDVGQVITTGDTAQGQCGNGPSWTNVDSFNVKMPGNVVVRQIAAGNTYTLCLTESNNVYYFGTCKFAVPTGPYNVPTMTTLFKENQPTLYEELKRMHIEQIASGAAHMLFLRKDLKVFSVGSPDGGRLGRIGPSTRVLQIHSLEDMPVTKIGCGYNTSSAYCSSTGQVFVWGKNDKMQCGIDSHTGSIEAPTELTDLREAGVRDVVTSFNGGFAITDKGPYSWGLISHMAPGFGPVQGPTGVMPIEWFRTRQKQVVKIATGLRHSLALGAQGEVYSWGISQLGQCGHGDTFTYSNPTRIYDLPGSISSISACGNLSIAFTGLIRTPLSEDLQKCINNPDSFPDLIFEIGDTPIYAHKAMIIARCTQLHPKLLHALIGDSNSVPAEKLYGGPVKITETHLRSSWVDGAIPTAPTPNFEITTIKYNHTLDGTAVDVESFLSVLRYIYTDVFSSATAVSKHISQDFGIVRLTQLMEPGAALTIMPSTYAMDIDCLIHSPPESIPQTSEELAWASKRAHFKNLIGAFSDLTLTSMESGVSINAHRFLLCTRSEFFTTLLTGGMAEAKSRCVSLDSDESTIKWLLRFLYTDQPCTVDINVTVELLKIGAMLQLSRLVFLCSRFIEKELDIETTAYMYHLTATHSITTLRDICWSLITQDFDGIMKTEYWANNLTQEERDAWLLKFQNPGHN